MKPSSRLRRIARAQAERVLGRWLPFPPGHFYSPVTDPDLLVREQHRLWPVAPACPGIEFRPQEQAWLLESILPALLDGFDYPDHPGQDPTQFHLSNPQFGEPDARALFALLRHWRPGRMVEVGSGYSTLLANDINRRFLDGTLRFTAIEPFPRAFLRQLGDNVELRVEPVQDTPLEVFLALRAGDVLFVDSSHVMKTGSDLTHVLTGIMPLLAQGVRVHFHDVFLPDDYPPGWAIGENRSWNEQYAVQAMLAANPRYRVIFGVHFALTRLSRQAQAAFGAYAGQAYTGSSFWIEIQ